MLALHDTGILASLAGVHEVSWNGQYCLNK
jgi:hypothetical protein